jgi:hypothetical protein
MHVYVAIHPQRRPRTTHVSVAGHPQRKGRTTCPKTTWEEKKLIKDQERKGLISLGFCKSVCKNILLS